MFYWKLISASSASKSDGNMAASNFVNVMPQVIGVSSNPSESTSLERKKSRKPRLRYADNAISQSGTAKEKLNFLFVLMPLLFPPLQVLVLNQAFSIFLFFYLASICVTLHFTVIHLQLFAITRIHTSSICSYPLMPRVERLLWTQLIFEFTSHKLPLELTFPLPLLMLNRVNCFCWLSKLDNFYRNLRQIEYLVGKTLMIVAQQINQSSTNL